MDIIPEIEAIFLSYNVAFHRKNINEFINVFSYCDDEKLFDLLIFHEVRPIFYKALQEAGIQNAKFEKLKLYCINLALKQKIYTDELDKFLSFCRETGISSTTYKGVYFSQKLYTNSILREFSDLDFLILDPHQISEFVNWLLKNGYQLKASKDIEEIVHYAQGREVSLVKKGWLDVHLDLHWGVNETYHHYNISASDFVIKNHEKGEEESLFYMILNHHGGREQWLKIKDLFDFARYLELYDNHPLSGWAKDKKLQKVYLVGRSLVDKYIHLEKQPTNFVKNLIKAAWENTSSYRSHIIPKAKKFILYLGIQDKEVSKLQLTIDYMKYHSSYSPVNPLQSNFKPTRGIWNFPLKFIKMAYLRIIGKYNK
ncbi:hypothetical protein Lbys_2459 [Leadbetterella byssophila DSM 17132]|uniref:Nucleotidyltransferase family protein n=1 Tax=Leadbetterella byssophila (strain DSM 17132 / JCM 16389 / KACC 11308 / NBRC 106382 / 4M15) TaxID=649349 RepID=E4RXR0_LEAB4|nr:nucleotidyltransferase family protein [Leadbetterella byssophila]ADQ18124.1 hypothetical protein Lbys_2459 [Leadbetterella byssophila DSM 17132]